MAVIDTMLDLYLNISPEVKAVVMTSIAFRDILKDENRGPGTVDALAAEEAWWKAVDALKAKMEQP